MLFNKVQQQVQFDIQSTEKAIVDLQAQLENLQKHLQAIGSMEQAGVSAIEQVKVAVSMINAIAPQELETFRTAVNEMIDSNVIAELPEDESEDSPHTEEEEARTVEVDVLIPKEPQLESEITRDSFSHLSTGEIRTIVRNLGLITNGTRFMLIDRLIKDGFNPEKITQPDSEEQEMSVKNVVESLQKPSLDALFTEVGLGSPSTRRISRLIEMILQKPEQDVRDALNRLMDRKIK